MYLESNWFVADTLRKCVGLLESEYCWTNIRNLTQFVNKKKKKQFIINDFCSFVARFYYNRMVHGHIQNKSARGLYIIMWLRSEELHYMYTQTKIQK